MTEWLSDSNKARAELRVVADDLIDLADSLYHVGQDSLGKSILEYARIVRRAERALNTAICEAVREMVHSSRESALSTVLVALQVCSTTREMDDGDSFPPSGAPGGEA